MRVLHQRLALLSTGWAPQERRMAVGQPRTNAAPLRLTPRERHVLALVARGCSNKEIGVELAISVGTARVHVEHILTKLDVHSRRQAAVWALHRDIRAVFASASDSDG
jgi:DNA-binding NarL/FixJ family response regulator